MKNNINLCGTIIEAGESTIIVKPEEGSNERKSSDKISMKITRPTNGTNDFLCSRE